MTCPEQTRQFQHTINLTTEQAFDEIVADFAGDIFSNEKTLNSFMRDADKSIVQRFFDAVRAFIEEIKSAFKTRTQQDAALRDYGLTMEQLEKAERLYREAFEAVIDRSTNIQDQAKEFSDKDTKYSLRTKEPPKKTGTAYKVFYAKDGKLYPPMVANPGGEGTPVGVWLDADIAPIAGTTKTGRLQVQAGGKGTQASKQTLAYRPGWHLGDVPHAPQFARSNPETGKKELFPADFVWAECEYAMDVNYQEEAMQYGYTESGKFRHSYAGLPRLPEDGYYRYRTNPNPDTVPWIITGAMKVNRILTDEETDAICRQHGIEPMKRQGGSIDLAKYGLDKISTERYSLKAIDLTQEDFEKNISAVAQMSEVAKLTGKEFKKGPVNLVDQVTSFFRQYNNSVESEALGEVQIAKRGVKDSMIHGIGREKVAAFAAVPDVLKRGKIIDYQKKWKGNDYDTAVIAAPIMMGNDRYYMGVVVRRYAKNQRFYLHEVYLEEKRRSDSPYKTGAVNDNGRPGSKSHPSIMSLLKKVKNVNIENKDGRFSLKSPIEETDKLIAVHNLSQENLKDALELGGFAMPSIAVIKPGTEHSRYGDVSLVFGKDTVNPASRPRA